MRAAGHLTCHQKQKLGKRGSKSGFMKCWEACFVRGPNPVRYDQEEGMGQPGAVALTVLWARKTQAVAVAVA